MQAIRLGQDGAFAFSTAEIPEDVRREIVNRGCVILGDVSLAIRPELITDGRPSRGVLAVSTTDPGRFELIIHRDEAASRGFEVAGKRYHLIDPEVGWRCYLESIGILSEAIRGEDRRPAAGYDRPTTACSDRHRSIPPGIEGV